MRALTKGPKPDVLVRKEGEWTVAYVAAHGTDTEKQHEKWRHKDIKAALKRETASKCAYCEAYVEDVSFPHVEHIVPKTVRPELAHNWHNLTSACGQCNTWKSDFYDEEAGLLNPYVDDLVEHLQFFGDFVDWRLGAVRGEVTVTLLRLNRIDLVRARVQRLSDMRALVDRWHEAQGARKEVLEAAIRLDCEEGEFTTAVRAYLTGRGFPSAA